jgi:putative toxin-antitoxin system antitoxin component (TIGR02293 family)
MANIDSDHNSTSEKEQLGKVAELLGGRQTFRKPPQHAIEAHELLLRGLPTRALTHFVQNLIVLRWDSAFERAVGMSQRTYQRHISTTAKSLNPEQTARTWKLAEILARATSILGSKEEAEEWLKKPAIGLDQRRPIDLLATPAGTELVEDFLVRLEYGVYV